MKSDQKHETTAEQIVTRMFLAMLATGMIVFSIGVFEISYYMHNPIPNGETKENFSFIITAELFLGLLTTIGSFILRVILK